MGNHYEFMKAKNVQQPEALLSAKAVEYWAMADRGLRGDELRKAAAELRRMHARIEELERMSDDTQEDTARLDFLIEQRGYVVSDPDACEGYWLQYTEEVGPVLVQIGEYPTPRAAIDAARDTGEPN